MEVFGQPVAEGVVELEPVTPGHGRVDRERAEGADAEHERRGQAVLPMKRLERGLAEEYGDGTEPHAAHVRRRSADSARSSRRLDTSVKNSSAV